MSQSTEVFTRKTSGLVRVMSPYSAFAYNVLAIGILFPWVYLTASYAFPRANIPLGIIITGILLIPMWFCYSHLAASMPRSGGDYVFQSRILSGPVGFTATMIPAWFVMYLCFAGWMLCATGLSPMLGVLGFRSGNLGLYRAAEWFSGATGTIILSIVCLTGAILIFINR